MSVDYNDCFPIIVHDFMYNELKLKGNELLVFSLIYKVCEDKGVFDGGRETLSKVLNITKPTVDASLQSLIKKGLISRKHIGDRRHADEYRIQLLDKEVLPNQEITEV